MITFTALGFAASLLGNLLNGLGPWLHLALALLLIAMALQMFGVFELVPEATIKAKPNKGYRATFMAGLLAGAFSSHCTTPVLIAMLAIVANRASMLYGVLLLIIFSVGHGVLSVVAGTSAGLVNRLMNSPALHEGGKGSAHNTWHNNTACGGVSPFRSYKRGVPAYRACALRIF